MGIDLKNLSPEKAHRLVARVESMDLMNKGYVSSQDAEELMEILGIKRKTPGSSGSVTEENTDVPSTGNADQTAVSYASSVSSSSKLSKMKIGRNDPCICGSLKKYKKCCGEIG